MSRRIIMLSGYAQAGKDTLADGIIAGAGIAGHKLKYADELKHALNAALAYLDLPQVAFTEDPEVKKTIRPLLVALGEYARSVNPDVFVDKVIDGIRKTPDGSVVVIADLRYHNEYDRTVKCFGHENVDLIRVVRTGAPAANETEWASLNDLWSRVHCLIDRVEAPEGNVQALRERGRAIGLHAMTTLHPVTVPTPEPWSQVESVDLSKLVKDVAAIKRHLGL